MYQDTGSDRVNIHMGCSCACVLVCVCNVYIYIYTFLSGIVLTLRILQALGLHYL